MKGVVFVELVEMLEQRFSLDLVDRVIEGSDLPSRGAYTAVGTYDHREMVTLVSRVSEETGIPVAHLIRAFGEHLFKRFTVAYPAVFEGRDSTFALLASIESNIHVEVRKLYPDAQLPSFDYETDQPDRLVMIYRSARPFGDFAEGLIRGCIAHFGEPIALAREDLPCSDGAHVRFTLTRQA